MDPQIGPVGKNVEDCAALLEVIAGYDPKDSTSVQRKDLNFTDALKKDLRGVKIGIPKEYLSEGLDEDENVVYRPLDFIPLAEKNGTIIEIGNFVFREVFKSIHEWKVKYRANYIISINVSAIQLQRSDFIDNLQKLIDYYEVDPGLIELEITESVLINDFDTMIETLRILSQLGIRVSLDDFGTGFSSLSYLRELPITTLKIDKSFIDDICINNKTANITGSVVDMVKKLDLETVAEGVEHKEQLDCLKDMGCDLIQGFLLSKPVKKSEFEKIIIRQMP